MAVFETLRAWVREDDLEERAQMSTEDINDLPDSAFAYIEPGGSKDASGRTVPRSLRHFPIHDRPHVENALARMSQSPFGEKAAKKIHAAAKRIGIGGDVMGRSEEEYGELRRGDGWGTRAYDFEIRSVGDSGRTLEGHVAVFRSVARIPDRNGEFDEEVHPGIFNRYLEKRGFPVMQFDHGKDPRTGTVPIGVFDVFEPDNQGYFVRSRLFDNHVVEPIRQAIEHRAIRGWSWRMQVQKNGDRWTRRTGGVDKRDIFDADVPEAGPVVFPAYRDTKMSLRSWLDSFEPGQRTRLLAELREEFTDFTGQPARGAGGGDPDTEPRKGDVSIHQIGRGRELDLLRRPFLH